MAESRQMSRGHSETEDTIGLLCVERFYDNESGPRWPRPGPEHKDHSQQSPVLWAPAWCWGSECVWQHHYSRRCLIALVLRWIEKQNKTNYRWPEWEPKLSSDAVCSGRVFSILSHFWSHLENYNLKFSCCTEQILFKRCVYVPTLIPGCVFFLQVTASLI